MKIKTKSCLFSAIQLFSFWVFVHTPNSWIEADPSVLAQQNTPLRFSLVRLPAVLCLVVFATFAFITGPYDPQLPIASMGMMLFIVVPASGLVPLVAFHLFSELYIRGGLLLEEFSHTSSEEVSLYRRLKF